MIQDEKNSKRGLPKWLEEIGFDFPRDIEKIWALELPVEDMPIEELTWHFEYPFFFSKGGWFDVKPIDVINNPEEHEYRYGRIMNVDTNFPINIMYWKGKWEILDGLHRLCQLYIKGERTVKVRNVPTSMIPDIAPDL